MGSPTSELVQVAEGVVTKDLAYDAAEDQLHDVDPREERAFVSIIKLCGNDKLSLTIVKVWRLDIFFLTIGFLGYMFKYIDQTNIVGAALSLFVRNI